MNKYGPIYEHPYCDNCHYVGKYYESNKVADLYYCIGTTVIARHSDEPSDYTSGFVFAGSNPALRLAVRNANFLSLLTSEDKERICNDLIRSTFSF